MTCSKASNEQSFGASTSTKQETRRAHVQCIYTYNITIHICIVIYIYREREREKFNIDVHLYLVTKYLCEDREHATQDNASSNVACCARHY